MTNIPQLVERIPQEQALIVLTSNASIARELKSSLLRQDKNSQSQLCRVSTLDSWLERQAAHLAASENLELADPQQLQQIWEQIIEAESEEFPDLQAISLAPQVQRSWLRMLRWNSDLSELAELEQYNPLRLSSWCQKFEARLSELGLSQRDLLLKQPNNSGSQQHLVYIGSGDPLAPLHQSFLESRFESLELTVWRDTQKTADCFQASYDNRESEVKAAANWAQNLIAQDDSARIGILCTENSSEQKHLITALRRQLEGSPLRICLPQSFADSGICFHSLQLLQVNRHELSRADCLALIRNPFWGNYPEDLEQRALWETELCNLERKNIRISELLRIGRSVATKLQPESHLSLIKNIESAVNSAKQSVSEASPQYWAELFSQQLQSLGWPGTRGLNKSQQKEVELFIDLLQQLVPISLVETKISCSSALRILGRLAQSAQIQAESPINGINLLNTVESAVGFSHLWLLDASADHWPGYVKPDPLIPIHFQLDQDMPRCHPDHERDFCLNLFDQLRGNCQELVFSISQQDTDQPTEFSPLLSDYPELGLEISTQSKEEVTQNWQWVDCSRGPTLSQSPDVTDRGGSNIFNLMAASPFHAFAQYRLNARPFAEAFIGIGPSHRGKIIHDILDRIWGQLENSENLKQLDDKALNSLIEESVHQQLLSWQGDHFNLELGYFEQLKSSFIQLLQEWMKFESGRESFVVLAREEKLKAQIGPLNLSLRIDRIDELEGGGKLLIDYKTGASSRENDLLSSPPVAAQLPLYAISLEDEFSGLCFAQVVPGAARLRGIAASENSERLVAIEDWNDLKNQWRKDLTELAEAYAAGDSRVFETKTFFGRRDELASLHRMAEYQDLMDWHDNR